MNDKLITAFHDGCKYDNCECEDDRIQNFKKLFWEPIKELEL